MSATSLQGLVEQVANREGMMNELATTSLGTTTTAISTAMWQDDDYWEGAHLYVKTVAGGAAPQGEERQIRQFVDSTNTATLAYAMSAAIPSGATVQIYTRWSRAQIIAALNNAVANAHEWHKRVVDESLTSLVSTYSYSLASLTVPVTTRWGLSDVSIQWDTTLASYPYMTWYDWHLRDNAGTITLQFTTEPPVGRKIRLQYVANASTMSAASDTCGVDSSTGIDDFLVEWALASLWQMQVSRAPQNAQMLMQLSKAHRDEAERIRRTAGMHDPARKFRAPLKRHVEVDSDYAAFNFTPTS